MEIYITGITFILLIGMLITFLVISHLVSKRRMKQEDLYIESFIEFGNEILSKNTEFVFKTHIADVVAAAHKRNWFKVATHMRKANESVYYDDEIYEDWRELETRFYHIKTFLLDME